jgi:ribonuclease BN (tRNA processing enzyme)
MKIVVLGSGTANPHPKRSSSAFWLETGSGTLLLDIAASAVHRLAQERLDWGNVDAIWISHFHLDHCAGLAPFLFGTRHAAETRERKKPLKIFGAKGLAELVGTFDQIADGKLLKQPFPVEIVEVDHLEQFQLLNGLTAISISTPHTDESRAIRLTDVSGKTVAYTSDTGFRKDLATFGKEADLLIIESSFVRDKKTEKHLELAEAMYIIRHARPKRAMLTHLYAEWDEVDFRTEVDKFGLGCEVIEAIDGMRLTI